MQRLSKVGSCNAFIPAESANPFRLRKCGMVFSQHSKTLSCCFMVMTSSKRSNVPIEFRDMVEEIMECWPPTLALHLKIAAWHDDLRRPGQAPYFDLSELKTILVPRQALLKRLDPTGELSVLTVRTQLEPLVRQYENLVIQDRVDDGTHLRDALKIYNYFHQLNHATEWGEIALSCTCLFCFGKCVCKHTLLFMSLFKPEVRVPDSWITATPSLWKKCKSLKGTAGCRRLRLIEQRKCYEKSIDSKVTFLQGSAPPPFRHAGGIQALQKRSASLPRSCRPLHCLNLAMMTFGLRYV
jgi:hypothetical protein